MTEEQASLAGLISDISEACWAAGWYADIEFHLWSTLTEGDYQWYAPKRRPEQQQLDQLRALSERVGGWARWSDEDEEVFVTLHEWRPLYQHWKEQLERRGQDT